MARASTAINMVKHTATITATAPRRVGFCKRLCADFIESILLGGSRLQGLFTNAISWQAQLGTRRCLAGGRGDDQSALLYTGDNESGVLPPPNSVAVTGIGEEIRTNKVANLDQPRPVCSIK